MTRRHDPVTPAMAANRCWSALTPAIEGEALGGLVDTLGAGDVPVDHVCAELGPGCLEIATAPEDAVRSADSAALAKLYTKAYFAREGRRATFMAQLGPAFPGLGGHPSLSLRSAVDGAPLLCDEPGVLSKTGAHAIAGVLALLPELLAMVAPYPNSYRRFGPGNWAPTTATWGVGNYSCALRAVLDHPRSARLELRVPGADTSPHHCLAMFLGAALWGIEERLEPPPPVIAPADGRHAPGGPGTPSRPRRGGGSLQRQRGGPRAFRAGLRGALRRRTSTPRRPPAIASSHRGTDPLPGLRLRRTGPTPTGTQSFELTDDQVDAFARDGFVVVENLIDPALARRALDRYEDLFAGRFETGLYPDEWNWRSGVHPADLTRQICNAWKSDRDIARCGAPGRYRTRLRPPRRVAGRASQPGQRAVEASRRQGPRAFTRTRATSSGPCPRSGSAAGSPSRTPRPRRARSSTCAARTAGAGTGE